MLCKKTILIFEFETQFNAARGDVLHLFNDFVDWEFSGPTSLSNDKLIENMATSDDAKYKKKLPGYLKRCPFVFAKNI